MYKSIKIFLSVKEGNYEYYKIKMQKQILRKLSHIKEVKFMK